MIRNLLKNQRQLFLVLHLSGWFAWGLIIKYAFTMAILEEAAPGYFGYVMVITVIGIILTLGLRLIYRYLWKRQTWVRVLGFLLGCATGGYLWMHTEKYGFGTSTAGNQRLYGLNDQQYHIQWVTVCPNRKLPSFD